MAKSPEQILKNYAQHAERSLVGQEFAVESQDAKLMAFNIQQVFNACIMQGLIAWRTGIASPTGHFSEAVKRLNDGVKTMERLGMTDVVSEIPFERAKIIGFLVDVPTRNADRSHLQSDRLLDAVIASYLHGNLYESDWDNGMKQLSAIEGAELGLESYFTYMQIIKSSAQEANEAMTKAEKLFVRRSRNSFFSEGDSTGGGGDYNKLTVDYRLAAIMKKKGVCSNGLHCWLW